MSPPRRNLKILVTIIGVFLLTTSIVLLTGCLDTGRTDDLDLVVVSIAPQEEVVKRIAGEGIEVVVMVPQNMDPHTYSPTPSQLLKVAKADIYFMVGSGVEFEIINMDTIKETNPEMTIVDMSEGIDVVSFEDHGIEHEHEDGGDDDHTGTDPHIWLDPANMVIMADTVLAALISADPDREAVYRDNSAPYYLDLEAMTVEIHQGLSPFEGRKFLSYHPAWGYFADAFNITQLTVKEEGKEPGPQGVASLIDQARENNIKVVFVEPQFDTSVARQIAEAIEGRVVTVDPLASDYIDNLREVAEKIADAFGEGE
ncbi:MAG: metal ABC transporter solute-binding protein, Zn/Mn family [Thermoplasmatota archaeon]